MKKFNLIMPAAMAMLATSASGQSSVTMFGILDVNVRQIKNGDASSTQLGTDGNATSRFGFRGLEDLGGGFKAGFWLEGAVNPDAGTVNATRFFHRRSIVTLQGGFGEIRLGRDVVPTFYGYADYDAFGVVGVGDMNKLYTVLGSTADTQVRADNAISYLTPGLVGPFAQVTVAAGEGTFGKKYAGGRVGYRDTKMNVSAAYGQTEVNAAGEHFQLGTVGAWYDFGFARLLGVVSENRYLEAKERHYSIGTQIPVSALGQVRLAYTRILGSGTREGSDGDQIALGYVHNLSKSTALYGTVARIRNNGALANRVASPPVLDATRSIGANSRGIEAGVRVAF
jgi:predicted porin